MNMDMCHESAFLSHEFTLISAALPSPEEHPYRKEIGERGKRSQKEQERDRGGKREWPHTWMMR